MLYDDKKFVGSVIRNARKKAGLSQEQLSEKVGMTDKNLGNIENGKQFPQVNNFLKLIEVLNIPLEDFGCKSLENHHNTNSQLLKMILSAPKKDSDAYYKILNVINEVVIGYKG